MANRRRTDTITVFSKETAYGDGDKVVTYLNDQPISSFSLGKNMVDLERKTGQITDSVRKRLVGRKDPSITIESPLYPDFITAILNTYFEVDDTTTDGDFETFTIRQLEATSATAGKGIELVGAKLGSFTLSQRDGIWRVSAEINGKEVILEKGVTGLSGIDITTNPTDSPFRFDFKHATLDTVCTIDNKDTSDPKNVMLEDLSITVNFERADDQQRFRNSQVKVNDIICNVTGDIRITYTWDSVNPFESGIEDDNDVWIFALDQNAGGLDITAEFTKANWERPDGDNCIYSATLSGTIVNKVAIKASTTTPA